MSRFQIASFPQAFAAQKAAEYVLLSLLLAAQVYIGARSANPFEWGVFVVPVSWVEALASGFMAALLFFVVFLYPLLTFAVVIAARYTLPGGQADRLLPWISAAASLAHVCILVGLGFPGRAPRVHFWVETAIMVVFVFVTSVAFYPPRRRPQS